MTEAAPEGDLEISTAPNKFIPGFMLNTPVPSKK